MKINSIKGMHDVGPGEIDKWHWVESVCRQVFERASYQELKTPVLEMEDLFLHSLGGTTDIVEKEMYAFEDRSGHKLCLRPEGTASIVRSYIEHYAAQNSADRFYYYGPMFRYERPQKGRYRQFYQIGVERFACAHPWADVEIIHLASQIFKKLQIKYTLKINSLGCANCRPAYKQELLAFLKADQYTWCEDCQKRIDKNPLRVLDCKKEACRTQAAAAPELLENLCEECVLHFSELQWGLKQWNISYEIDPRLVRGLDYYQRTAFEFISDGLGAQNAIAGGGRYDGLVEKLGGPKVCGVGFAFGVERVVSLINDVSLPHKQKIVFAPLGEEAKRESFIYLQQLRNLDFEVHLEFENKSLKSHLKLADKLGADYVLILGEEELKNKKIILKKMKGDLPPEEKQQELPLASLVLYFEKLVLKR